MECPGCKALVSSEYQFCTNCGFQFENEVETLIRPENSPPRKPKYERADRWFFRGFVLVITTLVMVTILAILNSFVNSKSGLSLNNQPDQNKSNLKKTNSNNANVLVSPTYSTPSKTRIVARFVNFGASTSSPVSNVKVLVEVNGQTFEKIITKKGWFVFDVPCNKNGVFYYGDNLQFQNRFWVSCKKEPLGIGLFDWGKGVFINNDMDNVDGCFSC